MRSHSIFSTLALLLISIPFSIQTTTCNGYASLCDRLYSNVTFIGSHDSAFVGFLLSDNQDESVTAQLDAGIRFLQAQVLYFLDELTMCHTSCLLEDAGSLTDYLTTIATWLEANPDEVISLLLVNGDDVDVTLFATAFENAGLDSYAFSPASNPLPMDEWPTLGEMIADGTRLVAMLDYEADYSVVPWILDEFDYYFETAYDVTSQSDFDSCAVNRPAGATAEGRMGIINHFLDLDILGIDIPDLLQIAETNAFTGTGSIMEQADVCAADNGRWPNVVLVDYFNYGEVFEAQDYMDDV